MEENDSKLKGAMAPSESQLKGSLLKSGVNQEAEQKIIVMIGMKLLQRDSKKIYVVSQIKIGNFGETVLLVGPNNETINLVKNDLEEKLNTPGSAWSIK